MPNASPDRPTPRSLLTYVSCSLFFSLTLLFFSPLEVILSNLRSFRFSFQNVWLFQLLVALAVAGLLTGIALLLPRKAGFIFSSLLAAGSLASWLQVMFFNGGMVDLTGEEMQVPPAQMILNILLWVAVLLALLLLVLRLLRRRAALAHLLLRVVSAVLLVMQCAGFVSLAVSADYPDNKSVVYLSSDGVFEVGKGTNVVLIVLDTADGEYVQDMLAQYPDLYQSLSGWTYYPNAVSLYSRTYPSMTYLLTGERCFYDVEPEDYVANAFRSSRFLPALKERGTDIRFYSMDPDILGEEGIRYVENGQSHEDERKNLDYFQLEKHLLRIGLYKSAPYLLKNFFRYDLDIINLSSFTYRPYQLYLDPYFYDKIRQNGGLSVSDRYEDAFRIYHFWSAHPGAYWNSDLQRASDLTEAEILRGSFRCVEEYVEGLKKAGVYDQSLIIVTADHGSSGGDRVLLERDRASCPLLMVKYPHSDLLQPMTVNRAPVSHEDLFATVYEAFSCENAGAYGSGKKLSDFEPGAPRKRLSYYAALDEKNHEVALIEYEIDGDAADFASWHKTGNYWDILYSFNSVSKKKYGGS